MITQCSTCGLKIGETTNYCPGCGAPQNTHSQQPARRTQSQNQSVCLWCGQNKGFVEEEGKIDSKWGFTAHKVKLYICQNCGFVHTFGLGRTIFDFD